MAPRKSLPAIAFAAAILVPATPWAGDGAQNGFETSLASAFLQYRTKISILRLDDRRDLACRDRRFVDARVLAQPVVSNGRGDGIRERVWEERWTLDRCGRPVPYRVRYTEVGEGGVFYAITSAE